MAVGSEKTPDLYIDKINELNKNFKKDFSIFLVPHM